MAYLGYISGGFCGGLGGGLERWLHGWLTGGTAGGDGGPCTGLTWKRYTGGEVSRREEVRGDVRGGVKGERGMKGVLGGVGMEGRALG